MKNFIIVCLFMTIKLIFADEVIQLTDDVECKDSYSTIALQAKFDMIKYENIKELQVKETGFDGPITLLSGDGSHEKIEFIVDFVDKKMQNYWSAQGRGKNISTKKPCNFKIEFSWQSSFEYEGLASRIVYQCSGTETKTVTADCNFKNHEYIFNILTYTPWLKKL